MVLDAPVVTARAEEQVTGPRTPAVRASPTWKEVAVAFVGGTGESKDDIGRRSHHFNWKSWSGHSLGPTILMFLRGQFERRPLSMRWAREEVPNPHRWDLGSLCRLSKKLQACR